MNLVLYLKSGTDQPDIILSEALSVVNSKGKQATHIGNIYMKEFTIIDPPPIFVYIDLQRCIRDWSKYLDHDAIC
jgi:hypothetical protein